uniref:F-box protein n=1 Tax=Elaeophora elaphi TaxID=1147741 RepID=A0A0R3RSP3_9BILA
MKPFCWWAIDLITAMEFHLYKNGMSPLLEYNIYMKCSKADIGFYGFSFMNLTTDIPYIDLKVTDKQLKIEERQKILVEVIYYCCTVCVRYENKTDEEIIEDLATESHRRRLANSDASSIVTFQNDSVYCINVDGEKEVSDESCMFMLDVNTPAKVHFGAMHWNVIDLIKQSSERENNSLAALALRGHFCAIYTVSQIPDGECIRYASVQEYFVLCCCYKRPELCAYSILNESMSNLEENRKIWKTNIEVRNSRLASNLHTNAYRTLADSWTYRDFIYSKLTRIGKLY